MPLPELLELPDDDPRDAPEDVLRTAPDEEDLDGAEKLDLLDLPVLVELLPVLYEPVGRWVLEPDVNCFTKLLRALLEFVARL